MLERQEPSGRGIEAFPIHRTGRSERYYCSGKIKYNKYNSERQPDRSHLANVRRSLSSKLCGILLE